METVAEHLGKTYRSVAVRQSENIESVFTGFAFPCLIWDHGSSLPTEERSNFAKKLLAAGCRYFVCGGAECKLWHDIVDEEWVSQHLNDPDDVQAAAHVMTTWHEGESPDDVAFFFVMNTNFDNHDFQTFLIVHSGGSASDVDRVNAAVRRHALGS